MKNILFLVLIFLCFNACKHFDYPDFKDNYSKSKLPTMINEINYINNDNNKLDPNIIRGILMMNQFCESKDSSFGILSWKFKSYATNNYLWAIPSLGSLLIFNLFGGPFSSRTLDIQVELNLYDNNENNIARYLDKFVGTDYSAFYWGWYENDLIYYMQYYFITKIIEKFLVVIEKDYEDIKIKLKNPKNFPRKNYHEQYLSILKMEENGIPSIGYAGEGYLYNKLKGDESYNYIQSLYFNKLNVESQSAEFIFIFNDIKYKLVKIKHLARSYSSGYRTSLGQYTSTELYYETIYCIFFEDKLIVWGFPGSGFKCIDKYKNSEFIKNLDNIVRLELETIGNLLKY
ncbi:MAG: hypothetical protein HW421_2088 [Ignavibacteria bacterium]|nr:hypothetical protein [Ignavibacteria bacterium]